MGIAQTVLRSRTLAALASPHGVDRFLEQVNPMWAAHEVRARVVEVRRETDGEHPVEPDRRGEARRLVPPGELHQRRRKVSRMKV